MAVRLHDVCRSSTDDSLIMKALPVLFLLSLGMLAQAQIPMYVKCVDNSCSKASDCLVQVMRSNGRPSLTFKSEKLDSAVYQRDLPGKGGYYLYILMSTGARGSDDYDFSSTSAEFSLDGTEKEVRLCISFKDAEPVVLCKGPYAMRHKGSVVLVKYYKGGNEGQKIIDSFDNKNGWDITIMSQHVE